MAENSAPRPQRDSNVAQKLSRISLRDQAAGALRDMIVSGAIPGGARINEVELAATLGISRGPLREAIQRIGAEGLIEFRRNRGAFVREIADEEVHDMYEVRAIFEVIAARRAARLATDSQIAELREQIENVDAFLRSQGGSAYPAESDFHMRILDFSANPYLQRAATDLYCQLRIARLRSGSSPARAREALDEHRAILVGIAARDQEAAGNAMALHLRSSLARQHGLTDGQSVARLRRPPA
jgi:DNA-binding GntR family transcriptional regulator